MFKQVAAAQAAAQEGARLQTAAAKANSDEAVGRHISFIDRLLEDKAELNRQCEKLTAQLRAMEEKHAVEEARYRYIYIYIYIYIGRHRDRERERERERER